MENSVPGLQKNIRWNTSGENKGMKPGMTISGRLMRK
jgi:hypothetical protein